MEELSIIVPVYRAEKFLDKCVESILSQTLQDLELILVDDGSPDNSLKLCHQWKGKDNRVRVIHQENAGVSAARNRGLEIARGKYVGFVDSDDFVDPDMYRRMLEEARSADVVMCDFLTVYADGRKEQDTISLLPESCTLAHKDFYPELLREFAQSACRCLYRRSLIEDHEIRFPEGLLFSEDRVFNFYAMGFSDRVRYLKEPLYGRFVNLESCVNTFHPDYAVHGKHAADLTRKALAEVWEDDPDFQTAFLQQYAGTFFGSLNQLRQKHCPLSFLNRMKKIREICHNSDFRQLLKTYGYGDREGRLILKKRYLRLYFYDSPLDRKLQNIQEEYELEGISGVLRKTFRKLTGRA